MKTLQTMPASGVIVISIIAVLFILAVILLFYVRIRYRLLESKAGGKNPESRGFRAACQHPGHHLRRRGPQALRPAPVRALPE